MGIFSAIFGSKPSHPATEPVQEAEVVFERKLFHFADVPRQSVNEGDVNVYPMRDTPVPIISVDEVVKSQGELIAEINSTITLSEELSDELLFPVIYNLGELVHLIPASSHHHHKGRGGLFRHSLEVGKFCCNQAKSHIFGYHQSASENFRNKDRWYLACCIAGLLHDVGKVLTSVTVTGNGGQTIWHPLSENILDWARRENLKSYMITWNAGENNYDLHMFASPLFFYRLVGEPTRRYLEEADSQALIAELVKALSSISDSQSLISNIVRSADMLSTQRDVAFQLQGRVTPGVDSPIASAIEGVITTLIERGSWKANQFDETGNLLSPLLVTNKGIFLYWLMAHPIIVKELDKERADSVPRDPDRMAEKMCEAHLCDYFDKDKILSLWKVIPVATVEGVNKEDAQILYPVNEAEDEEESQDNQNLTEEEKAALQKELKEELKKEEKSDSGTKSGESEATKKDAPKKPEYNWLNCLKISDNTALFAHVSRPAPTLAMVLGVPTSVDEARRWTELTHDAAPKTMIDRDEASLVQAVEREMNQQNPTIVIENGMASFNGGAQMEFTEDPVPEVPAGYDKLMSLPQNQGAKPIVRSEQEMNELTKNIPGKEKVVVRETQEINNFANVTAENPASSEKDNQDESGKTETTESSANNDKKAESVTVEIPQVEVKRPKTEEEVMVEEDLAKARALGAELDAKEASEKKEKAASKDQRDRAAPNEADFVQSLMPKGVKPGDEKKRLGPIPSKPNKPENKQQSKVSGEQSPAQAQNQKKEPNKDARPNETKAIKPNKPKIEVPPMPMPEPVQKPQKPVQSVQAQNSQGTGKTETVQKKEEEVKEVKKDPFPSQKDKPVEKPKDAGAGIEEKAASQKKGKKRGRKPKNAPVEEVDFKDTPTGKHMAHKTDYIPDAPRRSKKEADMEAITEGLIVQLIQGQGILLTGMVMEDGVRKIEPRAVQRILEDNGYTLDDYIDDLQKRQVKRGLKYDPQTHRFTYRVRNQ